MKTLDAMAPKKKLSWRTRLESANPEDDMASETLFKELALDVNLLGLAGSMNCSGFRVR